MDHRGFQTVKGHDFRVASAVSEILLCDGPERITLDNGMDLVSRGGRLGAYRYWDMDIAIKNALELAETL